MGEQKRHRFVQQMTSFRPANDENGAVSIFSLSVILDIFNFFFYHYIFPLNFFFLIQIMLTIIKCHIFKYFCPSFYPIKKFTTFFLATFNLIHLIKLLKKSY